MTNPIDPFDGLILDEEEQAIEDALERGEFKESGDLENTKKMLAEAARLHRKLSNSKPITLRVNQLDLIKIKAKAKRNNIPYQTLLSAMIHDYADGNRDLVIK
jgi:predicted DNA binding CopG/RHH family protein